MMVEVAAGPGTTRTPSWSGRPVAASTMTGSMTASVIGSPADVSPNPGIFQQRLA